MMVNKKDLLIDLDRLTEGEKNEMVKLGIIAEDKQLKTFEYDKFHSSRPPIDKKSVHIPDVLNEAYDYQKPSSFSRAIGFHFADHKILLISGTASVNEEGQPEHIGDFKAQTWRTYRNISNLLQAEDMSWHDVVRTTNYLRDMERDYETFNKIRTSFFRWLGLEPLPAATGIQATLCWSTLLVEIEAIAVKKTEYNR